jgi:hypothetical protein
MRRIRRRSPTLPFPTLFKLLKSEKGPYAVCEKDEDLEIEAASAPERIQRPDAFLGVAQDSSKDITKGRKRSKVSGFIQYNADVAA